MRCLYCGKQLPLLKKLTGGGEFCSEAHRQKYQEEYNKLALSRLLQTQNTDADAPNRGELVLASRTTHPALQSGRPPLRALEAPKSPADPPLSGNWAPGTNRTQRALPPPMTPPTLNPPTITPPPSGQPSILRNDPPPPVVNERPKAFDRRPLPAPQPPPEPVRNESRLNEFQKKVTPTKRDAFTFRPADPFQAELATKPVPPPEESLAPPVKDPVVPAPPPPAAAAVKALEPADPPQATFLLELVRKADPPPPPKLETTGVQAFTNGKPPGPDGWTRWDPGIEWESELLETSTLLPLPEPPGSPGSDEVSRQLEEDEKDETRKKILENQVRPGEFQQTVPMAPEGPTAVLPICPPAPALEWIAVMAKAKAPASDPNLYLAAVTKVDDLWTGWSLTGLAPLRRALTLEEADPSELLDVPVPAEAAAEPPSNQATSEAKVPAPVYSGAAKASVPAPAAKPVAAAEPPRNYKAAEALKSAAQAVANGSASTKAETLKSDQPSPVRHEVFVDLSVLGIEEDEDAEAESSAREGESPPGDRPRKARRNSNARPAVRDLVALGRPVAPPLTPKLAPIFQAVEWQQPNPQALRLTSEPLRPKVVFERQEPAPVESAKAEKIKTEAAKAEETAPKSSLASAWSAKRLKKNDTGVPPQAPGDSGPQTPVETPERAKSAAAAAATTSPAPPPAPVAKIEVAESPKAVEAPPPAVELPAKESTPAPVAPKPEAAAPAIRTSTEPGKPATINAAKLPTPEPIPDIPPFEAPTLGMGAAQNGSFWANLPVLPKVALVVVVLAAIGGGVWMALKPPASSAASAPPQKTQKGVRVGSSLLMNLPGGWSPDWGGEFNRGKNRTISFYRPSASNEDYRIEFEGQVDSKALGWVYRAADPKNYYAYKVEFIRTGADPSVALTHFAVVNGLESQKHYSPLAKPLRTGVPFRVRLDVTGDEFSAYINDELIEVWQDGQLPKGGFGLMTEAGETAQIRKMQVFDLLP